MSSIDPDNLSDTKAKWKALPSTFQPHEWAVICGKGKSSFNHAGNRRFRILCELYLDKFREASTKAAKTQVVSMILDAFRVRNEAFGLNGFVKRGDQQKGELDRWYEVPDEVCREKVGNALRTLMCAQDPVKMAYRREQRKPLHRRKIPVPTLKQWPSTSAATSSVSSAETPVTEKPSILMNSHLESTSNFLGARNTEASTDSSSSGPLMQSIGSPGADEATMAMKRPTQTELLQGDSSKASLFHMKAAAREFRKMSWSQAVSDEHRRKQLWSTASLGIAKPTQAMEVRDHGNQPPKTAFLNGIAPAASLLYAKKAASVPKNLGTHEGHPMSLDTSAKGTVTASSSSGLREWYERLEEMLTFCEEHGTDPREWPLRPALAHWISQQRRHSLSEHQAQCLDALGIVWDEESKEKLRMQIRLRLSA